ncbi:UvrD-helicase domain-containing protein [Bacillus sp. N9]
MDIVKPSETDASYFRELEKQGIQLNRAQVDAVRKVDGPLLVLAGAGTGKTSALVCRTGYLLHVKQVAPKHVLLMTFTKKAADEMKGRISALPGINDWQTKQVEVRTYHSFFLHILRHAGYRQEMLTSDSFKQILLKKKMRELGMADELQPESILSVLSLYKMSGKTIEQMPEKTQADKEIKQLAVYYEQWKRIIKNLILMMC